MQGGEIGSGHSLVAVVELTPTRQLAEDFNPGKKGFAKLVLNYKLPNDSLQRKSYYDCPLILTEFNDLPACYRFASATIIFGSLLKKSRFTPHSTWDDVLELANQSYDPNDQAQKEFLVLVEKAKKIYGKEKKRKKPAE